MRVTKPSLPHRPGIDGLRASAVLSVIAGKRYLASFDHVHLSRAASNFLLKLNVETIFWK